MSLKMKNTATTILFCLLLQSLFSQERALGTWKSFMPYGQSIAVCDAGDKIYCAATKSVFSYEKSTGTIQLFDKATGLYDIGIKTMNYDIANKVLVIAYNNSNIDLLYKGTDVYNIPDIKNKATTGAVAIYGISFYGTNAYICSDLGISVIDLAKKEISNTYVIGTGGTSVKVYSTTTNGTTIFAATDEGLKHASFNSANLQDFNSWILYDSTQNLPKKKATYVTAFNNKVYAVISANGSDTLYEYNGTSWVNKWSNTNNIITSMNVVNGNLCFTVYDNNGTTAGKLGKIDAAGNFTIQNSTSQSRPVGWFESNGTTWIADLWWGLLKINQGAEERIVPDGPGSSFVAQIEIKEGVVSIASGGADDVWYPNYSTDGFFIYKNGKWDNHNGSTDGVLNSFPGIAGVTSVPALGKTYFAAFSKGYLEYTHADNSLVGHGINNPSGFLEPTPMALGDSRVSCITADRHNNVWLANAGATKAIKVIKADGGLNQFAVPYDISVIKKIVIDQNDQLWMPLRYVGGGLLVWTANGTIDDPSDDKFRLLKNEVGAGALPDITVFTVAEDKEGNMWTGTNAGIAVFYCAGSILSSNGCDADQIKVERDGYVGYLFGTESIRAICVDAANRKWIGTTNGLWLISADGKTELLKFTEENSPLPSNTITDIAIDDATGEVFIGTAGGLVSYQGDAIAECRDCNAAIVYPNPVKPDYDGPIAIKGLVDNAYVKITDVAGTLIYQGKANGTQMIWNGKGYAGTRAKSGVYLVFSSTDAGKEKRVGKILIAN